MILDHTNTTIDVIKDNKVFIHIVSKDIDMNFVISSKNFDKMCKRLLNATPSSYRSWYLSPTLLLEDDMYILCLGKKTMNVRFRMEGKEIKRWAAHLHKRAKRALLKTAANKNLGVAGAPPTNR